MSNVVVVDYGSSNLRSVAKALEHVGGRSHAVTVSGDAARIQHADKVVFPGQGAIGDCMRSLYAANLVDALRRAMAERPFLGICLGLQSLMTHSDEDGGTACLDCFRGNVRRFRADAGPAPDGSPRKIPHMGWNVVHWRRPHALLEGIAADERFYFVHSYYVVPEDDGIAIGETDYIDRFVSAIAQENVFATQFHPEKSAAAGLRLLRNFLAWDGG